jgi:hypothetical protein
MLRLLPYKENTNFVVEPSLLRRLSLHTVDGQLPEKIYAYACFLPPGKHNTCIMYNSAEDPSCKLKNLYPTIVKARPREYPIALKYKKI